MARRAPARGAKAAATRRARKPAKRMLITYRRSADPSPRQSAQARRAVQKTRSAKVLDEIPGTLQVEVNENKAPDLRRQVQRLPDWDIAEESTASMPESPSLQLPWSRTKKRNA